MVAVGTEIKISGHSEHTSGHRNYAVYIGIILIVCSLCSLCSLLFIFYNFIKKYNYSSKLYVF